MAVEHLKGAQVMTGQTAEPILLSAPGLHAAKVHCSMDRVEISAAATVASTYLMARLPSNARLLDASNFSHDDLASSGSPTIDFGVYNPALPALLARTDITDDPDAINDGLDVFTAAVRKGNFIKAVDNVGKMLWEFVAGLTADPGGMLDIKAVIADADCNTGGTLRTEIYWTI